MKKRKIMIDCAPGAYGAAALALAAACGEELELLGITRAGRCKDAEYPGANISDLAEGFGLEVSLVKEGDSVLFMRDRIAALPEEEKVTLVAAGPLTNIASLIRDYPETVQRIREIVFAGGSLSGGNHTQAAEYNFYQDPEAAHFLFGKKFPLVMCGLDVTETCTLTRKQILKLCQSGRRAAGLCGDVLGHCLENSPEKYRGEISVHGAVPVMYLVHPEIFEGSRKILEVDCSGGSSRGAVLGGFRWWRNEEKETNVYVLEEADGEKFREYLITALYELA